MPTYSLNAVSNAVVSRYARDVQETLLASDIEELAHLRFSIVLTARWEASGGKDTERQEELRTELSQLRALYSQKIDEIAMTFGVQEAMNAKEEVERTVTVPLKMSLLKTVEEDRQLYF